MSQRRDLDDDDYAQAWIMKGELDYLVRMVALDIVIREYVRHGRISRYSSVQELFTMLAEGSKALRQMGYPDTRVSQARDAMSLMCRVGSPSRIFTMDAKCGRLTRYVMAEVKRLSRNIA